MVIASAALHVVVFGLALTVSRSKAARRATAVAVVGAEKKKPKPEDKPKPPPPKPKLVASAKAEPRGEPKPAPVAETAPSHAPAPVDTGLTLGNDDGPGMALPSAAKPGPKAAAATGAKEKSGPVKKEKVVAPKGDIHHEEEDNCTEAPSKPVPAQRPSEIEYTQEARANGIEGRLVLKITVGADGSVVSVEVLSSVDPTLDASAIAAVKTWVFKPSLRCGKAMAGGVFTLARRFELGD